MRGPHEIFDLRLSIADFQFDEVRANPKSAIKNLKLHQRRQGAVRAQKAPTASSLKSG
jgi:hypothetical protein